MLVIALAILGGLIFGAAGALLAFLTRKDTVVGFTVGFLSFILLLMIFLIVQATLLV